MSTTTIRRAIVQGRDEAEAIRLAKQVRNYLPANYSVVGVHGCVVTIEGTDDHGWTLDDYVIPRLASGLIHARECGCQPVNDLGGQDASPRFGADEHLTW